MAEAMSQGTRRSLWVVMSLMGSVSMSFLACDDETERQVSTVVDAASGGFDALTPDAPADAAADAFCVARGDLSDGGGTLQSRVLYTNDFETPNVPLVVNCPHALDARGINFLYGTPAFQFNQVNTVEGVLLDDPSKLYKNPTGKGGRFALGMLSSVQDDKLSLTFEVTGKPFLNVGLDLSSIDVQGCGGPFGVTRPVMKVSLHETIGTIHSFSAPGKLLAEGTIEGDSSADPWTFAWTYGVVSLDASQATTARVSVVFDLTQSGYAAFDNLSIVASSQAGIVDRNNDGVADDIPLCATTTQVCEWNPTTMAFDMNCRFVDAGAGE